METININECVVVSVDNSETFENKELDELYVPEGELAAEGSKKVLDVCKPYKILAISVLDKHPRGHISFASSYKNKKPFDDVTWEEVKDRTEEDNGLSDQARFTVEQLKKYIANSPDQKAKVWPDHGKDRTKSIDLTAPLHADDFDIHLVKGDKIDEHPYSGFTDELHQTMVEMKKNIMLVLGVAIDRCSGDTALDGLNNKYDVYVIKEAVRGIKKETTDAMVDVLQTKGAKFITIEQLKTILQNSFVTEEIID